MKWIIIIIIIYWPYFGIFSIVIRNAPGKNIGKISFCMTVLLIPPRLQKSLSNRCQPRKTHQSKGKYGFVSESRISQFLPNHQLYLAHSRSEWSHCRNEYKGLWNELRWRQWTTSRQGSLLRIKEAFRPLDIWSWLGNKDDL